MFDGTDSIAKHIEAQDNVVALQKEKSIPPKEIILKEVQGNVKNAITWDEAVEGGTVLTLPKKTVSELKKFTGADNGWTVAYGRVGKLCLDHNDKEIEVLEEGQYVSFGVKTEFGHRHYVFRVEGSFLVYKFYRGYDKAGKSMGFRKKNLDDRGGKDMENLTQAYSTFDLPETFE